MIKTILLILLIPILSNCSLVGFGVGALVDSANSKKNNRINSENQRINLVYTNGKKVKARYRGLIYLTKISEPENQLTKNNESAVKEIHFPNIGEKIEILDKEENKISSVICVINFTFSKGFIFLSILLQLYCLFLITSAYSLSNQSEDKKDVQAIK